MTMMVMMAAKQEQTRISSDPDGRESVSAAQVFRKEKAMIKTTWPGKHNKLPDLWVQFWQGSWGVCIISILFFLNVQKTFGCKLLHGLQLCCIASLQDMPSFSISSSFGIQPSTQAAQTYLEMVRCVPALWPSPTPSPAGVSRTILHPSIFGRLPHPLCTHDKTLAIFDTPTLTPTRPSSCPRPQPAASSTPRPTAAPVSSRRLLSCPSWGRQGPRPGEVDAPESERLPQGRGRGGGRWTLSALYNPG